MFEVLTFLVCSFRIELSFESLLIDDINYLI